MGWNALMRNASPQRMKRKRRLHTTAVLNHEPQGEEDERIINHSQVVCGNVDNEKDVTTVDT